MSLSDLGNSLESDFMSVDDILFLEVFTESLRAEMDNVLKLIEYYRSHSVQDPYYFNKKFLIATLISNSNHFGSNAQILDQMKIQLVSDFFEQNKRTIIILNFELNKRIRWSSVETISDASKELT